MSTILITGANGNLGQAVVNRLLQEKYNIIAVTGKEGGDLPDDPHLFRAEVNLTDEQQSIKFAENIINVHQDLDAAVLLVGGFTMGKLVDTRKSDLEKMIDLNFFTAYHLVRPLLKHFLQRPGGGRFILIGSRPGLKAEAGKDFFAYSLSKSMIFKLADFINAEGNGKNVSATVIVPSTIDTPANRKAMPGADFSRWVPAGNIADAIIFSLSETGRMLKDNILKIYNRA